jgi:PAS domain S-box-containing protein
MKNVRTRGIDVAAELPDLLPDPVIGCDNDGTVVYWSRAAEDTYGYDAEEALGQRSATLLRTRFPVPLWEITEELSDLGHWQGRVEHRCKDGRTVSVHRRWVVRHDGRGAEIGSFAIDRERDAAAVSVPEGPAGHGLATEHAPAAEHGQSAETRWSADGGPPARTLAHELNNALAIIINYTAFVTDELESRQEAPTEEARRSMRADLHEIQAAAERALEITRRMLG